MNYVSDDKIESARLEAKLGSFRGRSGTAGSHLNGQTVPAYDKGSDTVALGISESAAMHKREMERPKKGSRRGAGHGGSPHSPRLQRSFSPLCTTIPR